MRPSLQTRPAETAWQVFLSSTIKDLTKYRRALQDALIRQAEVAVFLSEDWPGGYDDMVKKCRDRVEASQGFLLVMGHWYGTVPPEHQKSITHLEFEWARGKWGDHAFPPLVVFKPALHSRADKELRAAAKKLLPATEAERKQHDLQLETFRADVNQVSCSLRTVREFKDKYDLVGYALVACKDWKGYTPAAAARGEVKVSSASRLTDENLGFLGREKQLGAVKKVLSELAAYPQEPAVCLLISGNEDAGQRAFLLHLMSTEAFQQGRPGAKPGRPPFDSYDIGVLTAWANKDLGLSGSTAITSPAELAERVAAELKRQHLTLVLDQVHCMNGGVTTFRDTFWKPFYDRLKELRATQPSPHRLITVAAEHIGDSSGWGAAVCGPDFEDEPADFSRLVLLPPLDHFKKTDLLSWLDDLEVPPARRLAIAGRVLKNSQGQPDPTPLRVFERLRGEDLQPEDEDE